MKIALAADHGGFDMKQGLITRLREAGHEVRDFGAAKLDPDDDYPDYIIPLARAVTGGEVRATASLFPEFSGVFYDYYVLYIYIVFIDDD